MNIFYLDEDINTCAAYHCDKHVVKMCIEYAQLLSTTVRVLEPGAYNAEWPYRKTHTNHPCAVWTRQSLENFEYLRSLAIALGDQFEIRYGKEHKSISTVVKRLIAPIGVFPTSIFTKPPQCMPDEFKCESVTDAYRNYYRGAKRHIATWKNGTPTWWY